MGGFGPVGKLVLKGEKVLRRVACFTAGTLISTEDGQKAIEEVEVGDKVWAWDEETGEKELKEVTDLLRREALVWTVDLKGNDGLKDERIETTDEHPWWATDGEGRSAWRATSQLAPGMVVHTKDGGTLTVGAVTNTGSMETVYNFTVEDFHT